MPRLGPLLLGWAALLLLQSWGAACFQHLLLDYSEERKLAHATAFPQAPLKGFRFLGSRCDGQIMMANW